MEVFGRKYFKGEEVFSDWFPREGDNAIFRAEVIDNTDDTGLTLKVQVYTKNTEETTDGAAIVDSSSGNALELTLTKDDTVPKDLVIYSTATGSQPAGFKELVRFKVSALTGGSAGDWLLIRLFPPIFFDAAESA